MFTYFARNYCRNPGDEIWSMPWCFTTDMDTRWEYCDVSVCPWYKQPFCGSPIHRDKNSVGSESNICVLDEKVCNSADKYIGDLSCGISGDQCVSWESESFRSFLFPDIDVKSARNYCRNPDNDHGPWCITRNSKKDVCAAHHC